MTSSAGFNRKNLSSAHLGRILVENRGNEDDDSDLGIKEDEGDNDDFYQKADAIQGYTKISRPMSGINRKFSSRPISGKN